MKFSDAVQSFEDQMVAEGRLNGRQSVLTYRRSLLRFGQSVDNRDPSKVGRDDINRYLANWPHPNTRSKHRSMLVSFFRWTMHEGIRKDNPVEQTRPPKPRPPEVYRLTLGEVRALLTAARGHRERRLVFLGVFVGARREELRLFQGKHFARPGSVWISGDIAKGGRERWVPVLPELQPVVDEIRARVGLEEFVFAGLTTRGPKLNMEWVEHPERPCDGSTLGRLCERVGRRAGIRAQVHPHMLRHAFADLVARGAGVQYAQSLLGHSSIQTTEGYLSVPTLDELVAGVAGVRFGLDGYPPDVGGSRPVVATVATEPATWGFRVLERDLGVSLAGLRDRLVAAGV